MWYLPKRTFDKLDYTYTENYTSLEYLAIMTVSA